MLPKDAWKRRDAAAADKQTRLDSHLKEPLVKERTIPYTDESFCSAAIEWLVSTDQVSGLDHNIFVAYSEFNVANSSVSTSSIPKNAQHRHACD